MATKTSTGYGDLVRGFGWRFDFKSSTWPTYKANVLKWAYYEDESRLGTILETSWDRALKKARESLEQVAPEKQEGKEDEASQRAFDELQRAHQLKIQELPEVMRKLQNRVGRMFLTTLGPEAATHVNDVSDPYEIWQKLISRFEGEGAPTVISILGQISDLKYGRGSSIATHVEALSKLFEALKEKKEPMTESLKCSTLMNSVKHLNSFAAWLTSENVLATTENHVADFKAMSRRLLSLSQIDGAIKTQSTSASYFNAQGRGQTAKPGGQKGRKGSRCHNCGKEDGHFAADCRAICVSCRPNNDQHPRFRCSKSANSSRRSRGGRGGRGRGQRGRRGNVGARTQQGSPRFEQSRPTTEDNGTGYVAYSFMLESFAKSGKAPTYERSFTKKGRSSSNLTKPLHDGDTSTHSDPFKAIRSVGVNLDQNESVDGWNDGRDSRTSKLGQGGVDLAPPYGKQPHFSVAY